MERISILDIFKIGVGPSSSHTLGPWKAGLHFIDRIPEAHRSQIASINIHLFGSLSKTGKGHGTDIAIMLGLLGYNPVTIDTTQINDIIEQVKFTETLSCDQFSIPFAPNANIVFETYSHEYHPNAMEIQCIFFDGSDKSEIYFSVGGGFIELEGKKIESKNDDIVLPFPIDNAKELLQYTIEEDARICDIVYQNELTFQPDSVVKHDIFNLYDTMVECVFRGCHTEGILPGGLNVNRRASKMCRQLMGEEPNFEDSLNWLKYIASQERHFNTVNRWVSCFALAVNEENAAFGRVVTSPTNGAAGVIPAVLLYYLCFCDHSDHEDIMRFMLTSGEIGCLFKKGATISAAVGGCQAEIGVSSAMAAAGLTEVLGGTPRQVLMAAEIAMEHHLGLTCDPIGGLVQIPCIERNAMGAMKAITASNIALTSDAEKAIVSLDDVIKTMWETAQDMNHKYKETSEGGLAINLSVIQPSC